MCRNFDFGGGNTFSGSASRTPRSPQLHTVLQGIQCMQVRSKQHGKATMCIDFSFGRGDSFSGNASQTAGSLEPHTTLQRANPCTSQVLDRLGRARSLSGIDFSKASSHVPVYTDCLLSRHAPILRKSVFDAVLPG